jgi:hypothetical protein
MSDPVEDADWADEESSAPVEWVAPPERDEDELAAIRTVRMVVVAGVLAAIGFVAIGLARMTNDDDSSAPADEPALGVDAPVSVGPVRGTAIPEYLAAQQSALASVTGSLVAVVSFAAYETAADADAVVAAVPGLSTLARLVALPGGAPAVVDEPLENWLEGQRAPLQADRDQIAELLPTIEDPNDPFIPEYQSDLADLDAQLASLDPASDLVFGLVVKGDADGLRQLAASTGVRLVAPGADGSVGDLQSYRGLRPEEVDTAGTPDARPATSDSAGPPVTRPD